MGTVEDFREWFEKRHPISEEEQKAQRSRIFHMHLTQAMSGFDGPIAQLILLGIDRELVMQMADACYTYWVNKTTLEAMLEKGPKEGEGHGTEDEPADGPDRAS